MKRLGETYFPEQHAETRRQKDKLVAEGATMPNSSLPWRGTGCALNKKSAN
ncbi:MAG TPA: hypothetical protein VHN12_13665 [Geobacteraceae bacterium]|nr:hypothetical protein [Geobacteraceae bacterium]